LPDAAPQADSPIIVAGQQPETMRSRNTSAVLRAVLARGPIPRSHIARLTGLSQASVTRLTTELLARRFLAEVPPIAPVDIGRPLVPIDFDARSWVALGMHLGRDRTTIAVADLRGTLLASEDLVHAARDPGAVVRQAATGLRRLAARYADDARALGVGVSVGGWVDPDGGMVIENDALGWRNVPLRSRLERSLELPVLVESNVRAMALTELWFGVATQVRSLVYVFIGNVVGAAIVVGRTIHRGPLSAAGGIAHMRLASSNVRCSCGRIGCFQALTTDMHLVERARERGVIARPSIDALISAARGGSRPARALLEARARAIGEGLAVIIGLVNPDLVVLAGSGVTAAPEYLATIRAEASSRCVLPIDAARMILPSGLGADVLASSSIALVLDAFYRQELPAAAVRSTFG
jgi:predicted NBD/HSP70 family sugar kinase